MVSLISIILDLISKIPWLKSITKLLQFSRTDNIVVVRRFPSRKVLHAHQLGLTLALLIALSILCFNYSSLFTDLTWYTPPLIGLLFIVGTLAGGPFVILVVLFLLALLLVTTVTGDVTKALEHIAQWYFAGYAFGFIFAILYNDLVYLMLILFCKDRVKIAFAFDFDKKINIIKSPRETEEAAFQTLLFEKDEEDRDKFKKRKLYNFDLEYPNEKNPYTIVFVANPRILKYQGDNTKEHDYELDPIVKNRELFLRSIDRALYSFQRDEVLGRREIWPHVRIVAVFDENLAEESGVKYGMLQPYHNHQEINGEIAENLLDPMEQMYDNYKEIMEHANVQAGFEIEDLENLIKATDVIYALSASEEYTRSTAHFSDWKETERTLENNEPGDCFIFNPDPMQNTVEANGCRNFTKEGKLIKNKEINIIDRLKANGYISKHDDYAVHPGRVALNVLTASTKTYIHEFAHAMSSAYNGAIVDEYFDNTVVAGDAGQSIDPLIINRIGRVKALPGKVIPVHKIFAQYDHLIYESDRNHPSAREDWLGYFPERQALYTRCTMDSGYTDYCWDKLIHNFMYDRLITKINR